MVLTIWSMLSCSFSFRRSNKGPVINSLGGHKKTFSWLGGSVVGGVVIVAHPWYHIRDNKSARDACEAWSRSLSLKAFSMPVTLTGTIGFNNSSMIACVSLLTEGVQTNLMMLSLGCVLGSCCDWEVKRWAWLRVKELAVELKTHFQEIDYHFRIPLLPVLHDATKSCILSVVPQEGKAESGVVKHIFVWNLFMETIAIVVTLHHFKSDFSFCSSYSDCLESLWKILLCQSFSRGLKQKRIKLFPFITEKRGGSKLRVQEVQWKCFLECWSGKNDLLPLVF